MKTNLKIVAHQAKPAPYDEKRGRTRIVRLQSQLMAAAVSYVAHGSLGTRMDRVREASDLSGIPRNLIEVEIAKKPG